jgi:hypothetical protein
MKYLSIFLLVSTICNPAFSRAKFSSKFVKEELAPIAPKTLDRIVYDTEKRSKGCGKGSPIGGDHCIPAPKDDEICCQWITAD